MSRDLVERALISLRNRDFVAAKNCISAFADENPLEFQHYLIKGLSEIALKDWGAAAETFGEAVEYFPHQAQLWLNLGIAQENLGRLEDAADSYEHSLDLRPEQGDACGNLSNVYRRLGLFNNAEKMAHRAYEHGAPKAQALNCLGLALARQGKTEAAEKIFRQILDMEPNNAAALANLANCAADRLDFAAAWPLYAAARAADNSPVIRQDEALAQLLAGNYMTGWPLYEARLERPGALRVRPAGPMWNFEDLTGKKLLIVAEQGFGDVIQFCRYGALLARQGAELIWTVPAALQRLLAANLPGTVLAESEPVPATDYWVPMLSLPLLTRRFTPMDAPHAPYFHASDKPELPAAEKPGRKVGIVWATSPTNERGHEKSVPLEALAPLWNVQNTRFYAPFIGSNLDDIGKAPIRRLDHLITDFADTAALLTQFDCLVTVDTAVAHLAGALGVRTYLMLPYCPDWRWGITDNITPFYPSVMLIRQPKPGDWGDVISQVMGQLA